MKPTEQQFLILNVLCNHLRGLLKHITEPRLRIFGSVDSRMEFPDAVETTLQEHCLGESEKGCLLINRPQN